MKLPEFIAKVKDSIDLFAREYYEQREKARQPDDAYPLENSQRAWFSDFEIWLQIKEAQANIEQSQKEAPTDNKVEFDLDF